MVSTTLSGDADAASGAAALEGGSVRLDAGVRLERDAPRIESAEPDGPTPDRLRAGPE
ncbi:hypothetical protein ACKVEX_01310 [Rhodocyclaceae bacterium SMB388]